MYFTEGKKNNLYPYSDTELCLSLVLPVLKKTLIHMQNMFVILLMAELLRRADEQIS